MPAGTKSERISRFLLNLSKHPQCDTLEPILSSFKNIHSLVNFKCKKHNISFTVKATVINRQRGGCPICCEELRLNVHREKKMPIFIKKAVEVHGNKYDYSKVEYVNQYEKITIVCPLHGPFNQAPTTHIHHKCGCPHCSSSHGEKAIGQFLRANNLPFEYQYFVMHKENRHYFDFYIKDLNLMIEYDGRQHYEPIKWFGGRDAFIAQQNRDAEKAQYCFENNIKLLRVPYTCVDIHGTLLSELSAYC